MTNAELKQALLELAAKLDGGAADAVDMLVVRPTGVLGQGKVRSYPLPIEVARMDGTRGIELCWSYALRLSYINGPDGQPYVPAIYRQQLGEWMQKVAPGPDQWRMYAVTVDRWLYPEDWYTQEQIDARVASDAQWLEHYANRGEG